MVNTTNGAQISNLQNTTNPFVGSLDEIWIARNKVFTPEEVFSITQGMMNPYFTMYETVKQVSGDTVLNTNFDTSSKILEINRSGNNANVVYVDTNNNLKVAKVFAWNKLGDYTVCTSASVQ
jgi:hypothetical protein